MKKIFYSISLTIGCLAAMSAQITETRTDSVTRQDVIQSATDRAARQADVNAQNNRNIRAAEDKLKSETERATGKEMKNPASTNSATVKPPILSDPATAPLNSNNRK